MEGPRKIFAHLLTLKPTPEQLVWWMNHEEELDRLLKGTELAAFIYRGAGPQRGGVLCSWLETKQATGDTGDTVFRRNEANWGNWRNCTGSYECACNQHKHWLESLSVGFTETCWKWRK